MITNTENLQILFLIHLVISLLLFLFIKKPWNFLIIWILSPIITAIIFLIGLKEYTPDLLPPGLTAVIKAFPFMLPIIISSFLYYFSYINSPKTKENK